MYGAGRVSVPICLDLTEKDAKCAASITIETEQQHLMIPPSTSIDQCVCLFIRLFNLSPTTCCNAKLMLLKRDWPLFALGQQNIPPTNTYTRDVRKTINSHCNDTRLY